MTHRRNWSELALRDLKVVASHKDMLFGVLFHGPGSDEGGRSGTCCCIIFSGLNDILHILVAFRQLVFIVVLSQLPEVAVLANLLITAAEADEEQELYLTLTAIATCSKRQIHKVSFSKMALSVGYLAFRI